VKGRIPEEILEEIRERTAIERIVGEYVPLKRAGRHFKGLCPFHQEKTPSFTVNTDLQIFKCFGCGESGNAFSFLMKYENISFGEAVERLARQAGVELPADSKVSKKEISEKETLLSIMKKAWKVYHSCLLTDPRGKHARKYLENRGYTVDLIKKYSIGYAPDMWDFIINKLQTPVGLLETAGLVIKKESSAKYYDRFRNRVLFPIREHRRGDIVAFGGRTLDDNPAKYINSPESPVYNKSQILYGLYDSIKSMRKTREAILVEGYFDRLALDKSGICNVVAPCGTSLTSAQVKLLKRSVQTVYMLFDADTAGIIAAKRALEICLDTGLETLAIPLPPEKDPDDIIREQGVDGIRSLIDKAVPAIDFLILSASDRHDISRSDGRRKVVEEMLPFLVEVENSIDRGSYISRIADLISVPTDSVIELIKRHRIRKMRQSTYQTLNNQDLEERNEDFNLDLKERDLFYFFIQNDEYLLWEGNPLKPDKMLTQAGKEIMTLLMEDLEKYDNGLSVSRIVNKINNKNLEELLVDLFNDPSIAKRLIKEDPALVFQSLIKSFQNIDLKNELIQIKQQLKLVNNPTEKVDKLLCRQLEILALLNHN